MFGKALRVGQYQRWNIREGRTEVTSRNSSSMFFAAALPRRGPCIG